MTLKDCTKEELIFIINNLKKYAFSQGDYYLSQCLHDVQNEREKKMLDEADKQSQIAFENRSAYFEFMKKYKGKKVTDIPLEEIKKAEALLNAADRADKKYKQITNKFKETIKK